MKLLIISLIKIKNKKIKEKEKKKEKKMKQFLLAQVSLRKALIGILR